MGKTATIPIPSLWTDEVRRAWEIPQGLTVSEWADRNRFLDPKIQAFPGLWHTDLTPYLREPMNAFNDPAVEEITLMFCTQIGKTEDLLNCLAYAIDQDPGPALWVHAREEDAKTFSTDRLQRMLFISPALRAHLTKRQDDISKLFIELDRMSIHLAGSSSPAALASKPIRYLFLDETDKYPPFSGKEADPIKLARERTKTYKLSRKIVKASSPTTSEGYINKEFEASDRCRYYVPCPHCGEYQTLVFRTQLKWPDDLDDQPEKIKNENLAWYECACCKGKITDIHKQQMLAAGKWVPEGCEIDKAGNITGEIPRTSKRGFHINALYSPWIAFSEVAAEFLECKDEPKDLMNFVNSWLAELWDDHLEHTEPHQLEKLIRPYRKSTVPMEVKVLTAAVDVQKDHFYVQIDGWAPGQRSWRILAERVETWEDVEQVVLIDDYKMEASQERMQVRLAVIDTGFRTNEVYEFCRDHKDRVRAIKGVDHLNGPTYVISKIDTLPKSGKKIPGGLKLWRLDTCYFKDKLTRLMQNALEDGAHAGYYFYEDMAKEYFKQLCAEHKVPVMDKKRNKVHYEWQKKHRSGKNNFLDTAVYNVLAADLLRVYKMRDVDKAKTRQPREEQQDSGGFVPQSLPGDWQTGSGSDWL